MLIIATALAVGHWLTESGAPARLVEFLLSHHFPTWLFLLAINALLLVLGCFLEVTATLLLVLPILAPALAPMGVDPVHFLIIFTHNMEIGLIHPPVGLNLFAVVDRGRPDGRGNPRHPAALDHPFDRACRHHLRAGADAAAAGGGVRGMMVAARRDEGQFRLVDEAIRAAFPTTKVNGCSSTYQRINVARRNVERRR